MDIAKGEILFLDTNILLSATDESRPNHRLARHVIGSIYHHGIHLGISGQVMREYLVVATRAQEANGLGLSPTDALNNIDIMRQRLVFFEEIEGVANELRDLMMKHQLSGVKIHDANVAATMLTHNITKLITENPRDFSIFSEIQTTTLPELQEIISGSA
jgi:predicted nucleic acid-binding protein